MGGDRPLRVALQGELGSFSDEAIQQLWGSAAERLPYRDFADVTAAVMSGAADHGVLPTENSIVGSISGSHDALIDAPSLHALGETIVAVHHCLLAAPGTPFESVRSVFSHPVALAQCGRFFADHPQLEISAVYDTAGAAMDVSRVNDPMIAAVASRRAAHRFGLEILRADIEDRSDNQTRFLAIGQRPVEMPAGAAARTMMLIRTGDHPGDLLRALAPFAAHDLNMRRLETRPTGQPWSYRFCIEFEHEAGDPAVDAAVRDIAAVTAESRLVGTYPRWIAGRPSGGVTIFT